MFAFIWHNFCSNILTACVLTSAIKEKFTEMFGITIRMPICLQDKAICFNNCVSFYLSLTATYLTSFYLLEAKIL